METIIENCNNSEAIDTAAKILRQGGLVAFPTETVYGLGGDALDPSASRRIYAAKGRPSDNPLIVHIADKNAVRELAAEVPETAVILMEAFWPGPLTIILNKKPIVPDETTGGLPTVAIRMPSHPAAMEMIRRSGVYVAAPSANRSGRPSPTTAEHVAEDLSGEIQMILDGGPVGIGIESTIVDLTGPVPMILRPGFITKEMLSAVVGPVELDPSLVELDRESSRKDHPADFTKTENPSSGPAPDMADAKKIILKGNHDYWWNTAAKIKRFFEQEEIKSIEILHNNAYTYGEYALCGTRGWFYEEEKGGEHDAKIMRREIMRLEASLKAAGDRKKLVFLHYPPIYGT